MKKIISIIMFLFVVVATNAQAQNSDTIWGQKKTVIKKEITSQSSTPSGFISYAEIKASYDNGYKALKPVQKTDQQKNAELIERENELLRKNIQRSNNLQLQNVLGQYINYASQQLLVGFPYFRLF